MTRLHIDELLTDASVEIIVCCGAGGVGKTTTAAALAVRAAMQGRRVCVLTIDPARRLAQAMGLSKLDNTPRQIALENTSGELWAMMLDMKRTFDEVVEAHADADRAEQIFSNPFYQALSSSFAGTQEYMAMEKLGQLHASNENWDLIIVDTPPARSALDFLDAPARLGSFLDGRFIRLLASPAKGVGRGLGKLTSIGLSFFSGILNKILGANTLADLSTFIAALDTTFGGFRERADATYELLKAAGTRFVVVAAPEADALREASYFVERLKSDEMPLAGVVFNRMREPLGTALSSAQAITAADRLDEEHEAHDVATLLRIHAERLEQADRQRHLVQRFSSAHPLVPSVSVRAFAEDVHDLSGLTEVGEALAGG